MKTTTMLSHYSSALRRFPNASKVFVHASTQHRVLSFYIRFLNEGLIKSETVTRGLVRATDTRISDFKRLNPSLAGSFGRADVYSFRFHLHDVFFCTVLRCTPPAKQFYVVVQSNEISNLALLT